MFPLSEPNEKAKGNLVAFLTFSRIEFQVNDLKKLLEKQNMYQWGFLGDSVIKNFLNDSS